MSKSITSGFSSAGIRSPEDMRRNSTESSTIAMPIPALPRLGNIAPECPTSSTGHPENTSDLMLQTQSQGLGLVDDSERSAVTDTAGRQRGEHQILQYADQSQEPKVSPGTSTVQKVMTGLSKLPGLAQEEVLWDESMLQARILAARVTHEDIQDMFPA